MIKYFSYILVFAFITFIANLFYVQSGLYSQDIEKCGAQLVYTLDSSISKNNIIYFGESSNFTYSEKDTCKKAISELLAEKRSDYKILTITKGAIHAETYKKLIQRIKDNSSIKVIIITLNLRSFGINWIESDLETNLSRANVIYSNYPPIIKKFCLSFKIYDNKEVFKRKEAIANHYRNDKFRLKNLSYTNVRDWDKDVFNKGVKDLNGEKDISKTSLACHFIKNYAFIINEKNPRIKDLDAILNYCHDKQIKVIFNLLAENYERANELCGEDLPILMDQNVDFLKKRYQDKTLFVDNSRKIKDSCFIDRDWPTEHYIFYGRNLIASEINERLKFDKLK